MARKLIVGVLVFVRACVCMRVCVRASTRRNREHACIHNFACTLLRAFFLHIIKPKNIGSDRHFIIVEAQLSHATLMPAAALYLSTVHSVQTVEALASEYLPAENIKLKLNLNYLVKL